MIRTMLTVVFFVIVVTFQVSANAAEIQGFEPVADRPGDYDATLEVVGGQTDFKLGDSLSLQFRCRLDGYVTIISIDPKGDVMMMYPNKWAEATKVRAGQMVEIPGPEAGFKLVARPPLGKTYVRAFVTPEPITSGDQLRRQQPGEAFSSVGDIGGGRMKQLMDEVKGFEPVADEPIKEKDSVMAVVTLDLTISDGSGRRPAGDQQGAPEREQAEESKPKPGKPKIEGEIPTNADFDRLLPPAHPKAKLIAELRDAGIFYNKRHEKGLTIPPTFSFDRLAAATGGASAGARPQRGAKQTVELLVEPPDSGDDPAGRLQSLRVERVRAKTPQDLQAARARLIRKGARSVQRVVYYYATATEGDPTVKLQWALHNEYQRAIQSGVMEALERATRRPVRVAVIDTGMAANHPDLSRALYRNEKEVPGNRLDDDRNGLVDDVRGYDFVQNTGALQADTTRDHGTFVSSIIAARLDGKGMMGVCPWAEIIPIRSGNKQGRFATQDNVKALLYAAQTGAKIVNCSWGGYGADPAIKKAMEYLQSKGILIIIAAGNDANNNDVRPFTPASYPMDNIITVAAIRVDGELASFSNFGKKTVDLAAPGELIVGYPDGSGKVEALDGTSFAAPVVSGAAAMVWAKHPDWTYLQVKDALLSTAKKTKSLAGKVVTGGMLDLAAAIAM